MILLRKSKHAFQQNRLLLAAKYCVFTLAFNGMTSNLGIGLPSIDIALMSSSSTGSNPEAAASPRGSTAPQITTQKEVDEKPWKYIGYKGYSEFISSDSDFLIFRQFDAVSARVALSLQDEVSVLEQELENLDRKCACREAEDVHSGSCREEQRERKILLRELYDGLVKYSQSRENFII